MVLTNSSRPASTGLSPDTQTTPTKQAPWTPGPWTFAIGADPEDFIVLEPTGNTICEPNEPLYSAIREFDKNARKISVEEAQANGRLIAKAPEMAVLLLAICADEATINEMPSELWDAMRRILREAGALL